MMIIYKNKIQLCFQQEVMMLHHFTAVQSHREEFK